MSIRRFREAQKQGGVATVGEDFVKIDFVAPISGIIAIEILLEKGGGGSLCVHPFRVSWQTAVPNKDLSPIIDRSTRQLALTQRRQNDASAVLPARKSRLARVSIKKSLSRFEPTVSVHPQKALWTE